MKILIIGAGSIGGYFGARLLQAGRDVTFLVREKRAKHLATHGLSVSSPMGNFKLDAPPTVLKDQIDCHYDLVILACKAYDIDSAISDFASAVGPETLVLPLLNGMRHIDTLDQQFGAPRVLGGLCLISTTLDSDGNIVHTGNLQSLTFGSRSDEANDRAHACMQVLGNAGFEVRESHSIMQDMWNKWVFIATAAALTSLLRGPVGDIAEAGGAPFVADLLTETASIAEANGFAPGEEALSRTRITLTTPGSLLTASLFRDMQQGNRIEADAIVGDLLGRRSDTLAAPILQIAYLNMKVYEARLKREAAI